MSVRKKQFNPDAIQHIYQRTVDCGVIFYSVEDRLVYLTTAAVNKRKYGIKIPAAALMFSHIHESLICPNKRLMQKYLQDTDSMYARAYNSEHSRSGRLFCKPPGESQKDSWKSKKNSIIYVFNNHVEKKLCKHAIDERWSLLAYAFSDHPFSEPISNPSKLLRKSLNLVDRRVEKGLPLKYKDLHKVLPYLDSIEKEQYIDYVISRYKLVDYDAAAGLFENLNSMLLAIDSTEGGEYNLKEDRYNAPDTPFVELIEWFHKNTKAKSPYSMSEGEKLELIIKAEYETSAWRCHLSRFFHSEYKVKNF